MRQNKTGLLLFLLVVVAVVLLAVSFMANGSFLGTMTSGKKEVEPAKLVWERTYGADGDDRAFSATKVGDEYMVVGSSRSLVADETVGWVLRLNPVGDVVWNLTFPAEDGSEFRQVLSLENGFLLVGNVFKFSEDVDGYVLRLNAEGAVLWNFTLGGEGVDKLFSAAETGGGFVLAGVTHGFGSGKSNVWVVKVSEDGNVVWERTYGGSAADYAARAVACENDYCLVAGYTNLKENENYDFLLLKLDASGELVWNRTYGGTQSDKAYALTKVPDGYVIVGDTRSKGAGNSDAWAVKVNPDGDIKWETTFGGKDFDMPTCITAAMDGGFLVGGFTFSFGNGKRDFWLTKLDGSGNKLWSCTHGRVVYEEAYAVLETARDEFVMAGWINYAEGGPYDYYVVKISSTSVGESDAAYAFIGYVLVATAALLAILTLLNMKKRGFKFSRWLKTQRIK